MPNGQAEGFNQEWCNERHRGVNERMDKLDKHLWSILVMLFINLGGIVAVLLK